MNILYLRTSPLNEGRKDGSEARLLGSVTCVCYLSLLLGGARDGAQMTVLCFELNTSELEYELSGECNASE